MQKKLTKTILNVQSFYLKKKNKKKLYLEKNYAKKKNHLQDFKEL